jgi:hypothetical protein
MQEAVALFCSRTLFSNKSKMSRNHLGCGRTSIPKSLDTFNGINSSARLSTCGNSRFRAKNLSIPDKIALYRGQTVVHKGVKTAEAVDRLIELIAGDGNWVEME